MVRTVKIIRKNDKNDDLVILESEKTAFLPTMNTLSGYTQTFLILILPKFLIFSLRLDRPN